jgi:hypothetical protein
MTYEEKRAWVYAVVAVVVPVVYAVTMVGRLADTDVAQISYARPLLIAAGDRREHARHHADRRA